MGFVKNMMIKIHRRSGDRFSGMDLLYLTTVGAKSGQEGLELAAKPTAESLKILITHA